MNPAARQPLLKENPEEPSAAGSSLSSLLPIAEKDYRLTSEWRGIFSLGFLFLTTRGTRPEASNQNAPGMGTTAAGSEGEKLL